MGNLYAVEISIIPLKKPILDKKTQNEKIPQSILKPKPKPSQKNEAIEVEVTKKNQKKIDFSLPKNKPLVVKKSKSIVKQRSKYYDQKDYNIAKKSIQAMEKSKWSTALSLSKKAKDRSIHNFINLRFFIETCIFVS